MDIFIMVLDSLDTDPELYHFSDLSSNEDDLCDVDGDAIGSILKSRCRAHRRCPSMPATIYEVVRP